MTNFLFNVRRIYLIDKEFNVVSYELLLSLLEYKTMIVRGDVEGAASMLPSIPSEQLNKVARFLEGEKCLFPCKERRDKSARSSSSALLPERHTDQDGPSV